VPETAMKPRNGTRVDILFFHIVKLLLELGKKKKKKKRERKKLTVSKTNKGKILKILFIKEILSFTVWLK